MKYKNILIDFDGTLVDSSEGIFKSVRYALDFFGHEPVTDEFLRKFIGPPLFYSFSTFCGYSETDSHKLIEKYRERYSLKGYLENRLYDGVYDTLKALTEKGFVLATASSKPLKFVDDICSQHQIKKFFTYLGGTQFSDTGCSKLQVIENVMEKLNAQKDNTLMVGDTIYDIDGAHAAGIPCCSVLYGFGSEQELKEHNSDYIIKSPDELLNIL